MISGRRVGEVGLLYLLYSLPVLEAESGGGFFERGPRRSVETVEVHHDVDVSSS